MAICIVCFDEMDMQDFNDPRDRTDTCFKLQCGHAYHTNCLVRFLQETNHKCAHCNEYKTPERRLAVMGLAQRLMAKVRTSPTVREAAAELREAERELKAAGKAFMADMKAYGKERAAHHRIKEKREYFLKCETARKSAAREVAKNLGNQYMAAVTELFRPHRHLRWRRWRTLHPRVFIST